MANGNPSPAETPPDYKSHGEQYGLGLTEPKVMTRFGKAVLAGLQAAIAWAFEFVLKNAGRLVVYFAGAFMRGEDKADPVFRELTDAAVRDLTGADPSAGHRSVGGQILHAMTGGAGAAAGGNLQPGTAGAEAFMETVMKLALEGYLEGGIMHALSLGYLEKFTELDDILAEVLGIGRMSRAVMRPLLTARVVTPMQWHVNKVYRPELLSPGDVVRQVLRGKWSKEDGIEELARQGFDPKRIDALFNAGQKFFSASDVRVFLSREEWTDLEAVQHLKDQGYDDATAHNALRLEGLKRFEQLETQEANALIGAYAARDIDRGTFLEMLNTAVPIAAERNLLTELAEIRRTVNVKVLSLGQVEAMVKSGVANFRDYRDAAAGEGYDDEAVTLLELQLRYELDKAKAIEEHRRELEASRAAAAAERAAQLAAKKAVVDAERALARRGAESDLERAVVRGLIPIARLEEVYRARYDDDTVAILVADVEADRLAYLAQQAARDEAEKRGARRNLDSGAASAAFMAGLLTRDELRARLEAIGFDGADAELLTATAAARKADLDAAKAKRGDAETAAAKRSIDLGRFEALVRKGVRSYAEYDALLASLNFDDAARAGMRELLELRVADDAAARQARIDAEPTLQARGLSLEQIRRAVLLGVQTEDDYVRFLVGQRFTTDAQAVLLAELRADVAEADAARARRETPAPVPQAPDLPLSTIRRAAQLGIITPTAYEARLVDVGYTDDDIAIELALLIKEIADVQAARARREAIPEPAPGRALSLSDVERAVKAGELTVDDYVARAITLGYSSADATTLGAVVERERATLAAARKRHDELGFRLAAGGASLAALQASVKAGELDVADYVAQLQAWGSDAAEAELLGALLVFTLDTPPARAA